MSIIKQVSSLTKYLIAAGVVAFISFLLPNHIKFKYNFENEQVWRYDDLYAPFDFAIQKSNDEIDGAKELVKGKFTPFYTFDDNQLVEQTSAFQRAFDAKIVSIEGDSSLYADVKKRPDAYMNLGKMTINNYLKKGLIDLQKEHAEQPGDFQVNLIKGNATTKVDPKKYISIQKAKSDLSDTLIGRLKDSDFLLDILAQNIKPNIIYDDTLNKKMLQAELDKIVSSRGMVKKDELIVQKNDPITPEVQQKLTSFKSKYVQDVSRNRNSLFIFIGYILLTSLIVGVLLWYLRFNANYVFDNFRHYIFIMLWIVAYSGLVYLVEQTPAVSTYIIPFCIVPIVIKNFYDEQLALFTHIVIILIASFLSALTYEFTVIQILAGIVAVLTNIETRYWSKFFMSMWWILGTYIISFFGLSLIREGVLENIDWPVFGWLAGSVFLTLLSYPLIPLLERVFGFTSSISLAELSDLDKPLLKELSLKAPGTFQHSLQVANLSEAAVGEIGGNTLLVKVAALYHDIGKMKQPEFYIENQNNGNPHDELNYKESAKIIIDHVVEGEKMAKKAGLPTVIINFIKTHHGTTRTEYFYRKYMAENPDEKVDPADFTYPGPNPTSKEETVLMITDSLEAASKSLKNPTGQDIDKLVDNIIQGKIANGQLEQSELTFSELDKCKVVLKKLLRSINHVRIEYPEEQKEKPEGGEKAEGA